MEKKKWTAEDLDRWITPRDGEETRTGIVEYVVYKSEKPEARGFCVFNLRSGEDLTRVVGKCKVIRVGIPAVVVGKLEPSKKTGQLEFNARAISVTLPKYDKKPKESSEPDVSGITFADDDIPY